MYRFNPNRVARNLATGAEVLILVGCLGVAGFWFAGSPLFYHPDEPVMSVFTALSLILMVTGRLARRFLHGWPLPLSLAFLGLVIGGNLSSVLMQSAIPKLLVTAYPSIVSTSVLTSLGLVVFCVYDLLFLLRETPRSPFILDDILLHLAFVPGGLSLLGHLLDNPGYLSTGLDPRVGISLVEMGFMALFAVAAVLSNHHLFLWKFLAKKWTNRFIFAALFSNQFVAPLLVAWLLDTPGKNIAGPGIELFVMLAGVVATLSFLTVQAGVVATLSFLTVQAWLGYKEKASRA